jgi:hypothetical protein
LEGVGLQILLSSLGWRTTQRAGLRTMGEAHSITGIYERKGMQELAWYATYRRIIKNMHRTSSELRQRTTHRRSKEEMWKKAGCAAPKTKDRTAHYQPR